MKKLLLLFIISSTVSVFFAQGISFEHGTFDEALKKAKAENKLRQNAIAFHIKT